MIFLGLCNLFYRFLRFFINRQRSIALFLQCIFSFGLLTILLNQHMGRTSFFQPRNTARSDQTVHYGYQFVSMGLVQIGHTLRSRFAGTPYKDSGRRLIGTKFNVGKRRRTEEYRIETRRPLGANKRHRAAIVMALIRAVESNTVIGREDGCVFRYRRGNIGALGIRRNFLLANGKDIQRVFYDDKKTRHGENIFIVNKGLYVDFTSNVFRLELRKDISGPLTSLHTHFHGLNGVIGVHFVRRFVGTLICTTLIRGLIGHINNYNRAVQGKGARSKGIDGRFARKNVFTPGPICVVRTRLIVPGRRQ